MTQPLDRTAAIDALRQVGEQVRPVALARDRMLPVAAPLAALLPEGGLRRGSSLSVDGGPGATSLALAMMAEASASGSWVAVVGDPSLALGAAGEVGLALERVLVVDPPTSSWAAVVAALLDAVDVVCTRLPGSIRPADARRLAARAREQGAVWVQLPGSGRVSTASSQPADVRLTVVSSAWEGPVGGGAGRLERRRVEVVAGGRGAAARERRVSLWLPDADGRVAAAELLAAHPARPVLLTGRAAG